MTSKRLSGPLPTVGHTTPHLHELPLNLANPGGDKGRNGNGDEHNPYTGKDRPLKVTVQEEQRQSALEGGTPLKPQRPEEIREKGNNTNGW